MKRHARPRLPKCRVPLLAFLCCAGLAPWGAGCSSIAVTTDHDRSADFTNLKYYDWMPGPQKTPDDPRIENAALDAQIRRVITDGLTDKGYQRRTHQDPDFYIGYHAAVERKLAVTNIDSYYGYDVERAWELSRGRGGAGGYGPGTIGGRVYAYEYDEGTLILDIVDPTMKHLMWRSAAKAVVEEDQTPEAAEAQIQEAVDRMLADFPPDPEP